MPQQPQDEFCKLAFVGLPRRSFKRRRVRVRPGAPAGLWCNSSISPCEGDGPGANPGFLTNFGTENPGLMNLRLMQSLTAAQNAGTTLVFGVPGGFVPLKPRKPTSAAQEEETGGEEA